MTSGTRLDLLLLAAVVASSIVVPSGVALAQAAPAADTVVVVLFDGWSGRLAESHPTPELDRLGAEGAASRSLEPAFPSVSMVNGASISTGCWPARHGIVGNRFVDPVRGLYDHDDDADWLSGCEHLHQAVERQGRAAAIFGWYGARSSSRGDLASQIGTVDYECGEPRDDERIDEALRTLAAPPGSRPSLVLVYLCGPDDAQHFSGVDSPDTAAAVAAADRAVGRFREAILALPDADRVSLVVTTDHGMTPVTTLINVTRILRAAGVEGTAVANDGMAHVYLEGTPSPDALRALAAHEEFATFLADSAPAWMRLGRHRRVGDLILLTEPPYFFADVDLWPWYLRFLARVGPETADVGGRLRADHGYDPRRADMQGILYLWGAGVPAGAPLERPRAVDIHPTVLELLGLAPDDQVEGRSLREDWQESETSVEQP